MAVCQYCGNKNAKSVYKKRLGTFCERCLYLQYTECRKCKKTVQNKYKIIYDSDFIDRKYYGIFRKYSALCKQCYEEEKVPYDNGEIAVCEICGVGGSSVKREKKTEKLLCPECVRSLYTCAICGKVHSSVRSPLYSRPTSYYFQEGNNTPETKKICSDCAGKIGSQEISGHGMCVSCGYIKTTAGGKVGPEYRYSLLCKECIDRGALICDRCNQLYQVYKGMPKDETLCKRCAMQEDKIIFEDLKCPECGDVYFNHSYKKGKDCVCRKCAPLVNILGGPAELSENVPFEPYNFVPTYFYKHGIFRKEKDALLIGTENEIYCRSQEDRNQILKDMYSLFDERYLYAKFDGSIQDREGFEVVTHPMSYSFIMKEFAYDRLPFNKERNTTCGMHVHLAKRFFDHLTLYKFISFIRDNDSLLSYVSERKPNRYSNKLPNKKYVMEFAKKKTNWQIDKHTQVNLKHKDTVEVRTFAQAISPAGWIKNIQFVVCLANFCKDKSFKKIDLPNFFTYLENTRQIYPQLYLYLNTKGLAAFKSNKKEEAMPVGDIATEDLGWVVNSIPSPLPRTRSTRNLPRSEAGLSPAPGRIIPLEPVEISGDDLFPPAPPLQFDPNIVVTRGAERDTHTLEHTLRFTDWAGSINYNEIEEED